MIERPDWSNGGAIVPAANPDLQGEAYIADLEARHNTRAAANAQPQGGAYMVGSNGVAHVPDDGLIPGLGITPGLYKKWANTVGGFLANDEMAVDAALDKLETFKNPDGVLEIFDALPVTVQEEIIDFLRLNPGASNETIYQKVKGKMTLADAPHLERAWKQLQREG